MFTAISMAVRPGFLRTSLMMLSAIAMLQFTKTMERGTLTRIKVRCSAGVMIARSDRVVPSFLSSLRGTKCAPATPAHSGSTAPTIVWGAKAVPPVSSNARRLCCERASNARLYISTIVAGAADLIEIKEPRQSGPVACS
jgi:hypothetical protein